MHVDQEQRQRNKEDTKILEWLSPLTFWATQQDTFERRQEGTGVWFLESEAFRKWKEGTLGDDRQILFCSGMRMDYFQTSHYLSLYGLR